MPHLQPLEWIGNGPKAKNLALSLIVIYLACVTVSVEMVELLEINMTDFDSFQDDRLS